MHISRLRCQLDVNLRWRAARDPRGENNDEPRVTCERILVKVDGIADPVGGASLEHPSRRLQREERIGCDESVSLRNALVYVGVRFECEAKRGEMLVAGGRDGDLEKVTATRACPRIDLYGCHMWQLGRCRARGVVTDAEHPVARVIAACSIEFEADHRFGRRIQTHRRRLNDGSAQAVRVFSVSRVHISQEAANFWLVPPANTRDEDLGRVERIDPLLESRDAHTLAHPRIKHLCNLPVGFNLLEGVGIVCG